MYNRRIMVIFMAMIGIVSCTKVEKASEIRSNFYQSELFHSVQVNAIFPDSKTFPDCTPKREPNEILGDYDRLRKDHVFELGEFVSNNFELPHRPQTDFTSDTSVSMATHIEKLWPVLTRKVADTESKSSLITLPYDYIVPGGRFSEVYYWDSYFTILGLKASGKNDVIENIVKNFVHLIDTFGFVPNGNRDYYLTRSQPPFFSLILSEMESYDAEASSRYLDAMMREYSFWMKGVESVTKPGDVQNHLVMLSDGTLMNRYWDEADSPRPEAYKEDFHLAEGLSKEQQNKLYRNIRSAAESGWDFSSRWMADGKSMSTLHTTDIIPVDLNCLLAHLENMIAKVLKQKGRSDEANVYTQRANGRRRALLTFCWDHEQGYFFDYDFVKGQRTYVKSLAGVYPLFFSMTQKDIATKVATTLEKEFLKDGGLVTTLVDTDQQWDAPNAWAPLQWMAYVGLKNYQQDYLANEVKSRWLRHTERVFRRTGKMMEKYNVMDTTLEAGGGEYPNQDGFGWTNGVTLAFLKAN